MTSNRYLSEILEGSRETPLAFVDRIAFLAFVPKGFAAPGSLARVLRAEVAGTKARPLGATLTLQDLDVPQSAVDAVFVPDRLCDRLAEFARAFEQEIAAARRADLVTNASRALPLYLPEHRADAQASALTLRRRFERWFPEPALRPAEARKQPDTSAREDLDLVVTLLASVAEVVDLVGSDPLRRQADAIEVFERLLYDAGAAPWRYAELVAEHPEDVAAGLKAVRASAAA